MNNTELFLKNLYGTNFLKLIEEDGYKLTFLIKKSTNIVIVDTM